MTMFFNTSIAKPACSCSELSSVEVSPSLSTGYGPALGDSAHNLSMQMVLK